MFTDLCYASAIRGTDATGVAIVQGKEIIVEKAPIKSSLFIKDYLFKHMDLLSKTNLAIGHTRNKTQGSEKDNNNNHPIHSKQWVMIHNGICSSMDRIKDYKYHGEVDSEILLSHVETYGLEIGLSHLSGYAAIALIDRGNPTNLYLWRHNEIIFIGHDRRSRTIFFASSEALLEHGLANEMKLFSTFQIRKLPEEDLFKLTHSPLNLERLYEIEIISTGGRYPFLFNQGKTAETKATETKKRFIYDAVKRILIPLEKKDGNSAVYDIIPVTNKYYFKPIGSCDFSKEGWTKEEKVWFSLDRELVKIYSKEERCHLLMTAKDAEKEKLIDPIIL